MRRPLAIIGIWALAWTGLAAPAPAQQQPTGQALEAQQLENRDDVLVGELDNGLRYVIKKHQNPPGRLNMVLHVSSGSLNETDRQRGLAHFLEHLAFNGSENFPPGETIKFFERLGLTFGRDQNAFTSFDQTAYTLQIPETSPELVQDGMLFLSDVLGRLLLEGEEIEKEREVILEEYRTGLGPERRVFDRLIQEITPGSRIAERLPIGTPESIKEVQREDFVDYWEKWYTTGNATLIVAGDMNPEAVVPYAQEAFGGLDAGGRPMDEPVGVRPYEESISVVITDPELTETEISLYTIEPPSPPAVTMADLRRELVDRVATTVFNRRLQAKVAGGDVAFRRGSVGVQNLFDAMTLASAGVTGDAKDWGDMLESLMLEVKRARQHGFTEQELADARNQILSQSRQFARMEATLPGRFMVRFMLQSVNAGEPILSAEQIASHMETLLPTITAQEASEAFASHFTPEKAAYVLTMPEGVDVPSDAELLSAARAAMEIEVEAEQAEDRPDALMAEAPEPGEVVEMEIHPQSEAMSAWLDNGARAHHREMDYRENTATIAITLAGGQIEETERNRGVTQAAVVGFNTPATGELTSVNIRDLLTGKNVSVSAFAGADRVAVNVSGAPEDLEHGLQVVHLLMTDPVIEGPAFEQWKQGAVQSIRARKTQPTRMFQEVLADAMYPEDDARNRPLEVEDVEALTLEQVQAWLTGLVADAPIEVAVVGDIDRKTGVDLVARYLGSLPERPRISSSTLDGLRAMQRPRGPIEVDRTIESMTPTAFAFGGFYAADQENVDDVLKMRIASQVLTSRMIQTIREQKALVYSIRAASDPAEAYPGFGTFYAAAPSEPAKTDELIGVIHEMFGAFAEEGPTEQELETAKLQLANVMDETMKEPSFWTQRLVDLTYRGLSLTDVVASPERLQTFSAEQVREAFDGFYDPSSKMSIVITPKAPEGGEQE